MSSGLQPKKVENPTSWSWVNAVEAVQAAGLETIPAIAVTPPMMTSFGRTALKTFTAASSNPLEEAAAYQQLLEDFGTTHEQLAEPHRPVPSGRCPTPCVC